MNKFVKKVVLVLLALSLLLIAFGCNAPAQEQTATDESQTTQSEQPEANNDTTDTDVQGDITLTVGIPSGWLEWGDTEGQLKQYEAETGITIEIQAVEDDQFDNLLMAKLATGESWDVFFRYTGTAALKYTNIADLSDQPWVSRLTAGALQYCTMDDKVVCAPTGGAVALCTLYNKTLFDKMGLTVPTTMDEFDALCQTLKDADIIPLYMGSASGAGWMAAQLINNAWANIYASYGDDLIDKLNNNEIKWSDIPEWMAYLNKWEEWAQNGYFNPNMASDDTATGVQLVGEEKCAMILTGDWQASEFAEKYPDEEIGGLVIPPVTGTESYLSIAGPNGIYVSDTSANKDAAKALVAWLCEKAQLDAYYALKPDMSVWTDVEAPDLNAVAKELTPYMTSGHSKGHWNQFYVIPYAEDMSTILFQLINGQKTADETARDWDNYMINQGKQLGLEGF